MILKKFMKYTIYINDHCIGCDKVLEFLEKENIDCTVINVEKDGPAPEVNLLVFPALFIDKRLIAYGEDIIDKLKSDN